MIRLFVLLSLVSGVLVGMWSGQTAETPTDSCSPVTSTAGTSGPHQAASLTAHAGTLSAPRQDTTPTTSASRSSAPPRCVALDEPSQVPIVSRPISPEQREAIQEILRMRKDQGDLFAGTSFAESTPDSTQQFAKILQDVVRDAQADSTRKPLPALPPTAAGQPYNLRQNPYVHDQCDVTNAPVASSRLITKLRDAAESLDAQANAIERTTHYADADRLRRLAHRIRLEARRWTN